MSQRSGLFNLFSSPPVIMLSGKRTKTINNLSGIHQSINQKKNMHCAKYVLLLWAKQTKTLWLQSGQEFEHQGLRWVRGLVFPSYRTGTLSYLKHKHLMYYHSRPSLHDSSWENRWLMPGTKKVGHRLQPGVLILCMRTTNQVLLLYNFHHSESESYKLLTASLLEQNAWPLSLLITISCICIRRKINTR